MQYTFKLLGYAGLIPFIVIPIVISAEWLGYMQGFTYFVQYSAIILSFFGGIHWYDALQKNSAGVQVYVAMLPSVVAWLSLVLLSGNQLLMVLSVSFIGMLIYDKFTLALEKQIVIEYTFLRTVLTSVVVVSHLAMTFV